MATPTAASRAGNRPRPRGTASVACEAGTPRERSVETPGTRRGREPGGSGVGSRALPRISIKIGSLYLLLDIGDLM